ncbi:MAG: hypothetical protein HYY95_07920 [Candidatus Rokubacteria bacterium]|nr:hypothetical protein [Candidatus Rokubacteria bacterium]MBI3105483.1 hypothetical protein [Candidatus Rokubacteria bacterium]
METETVEKTVTPATLRALLRLVEAARERLARTWAAASEAFRDVAAEPADEAERWRAEWRTFEPATASVQLHKAIRRLVTAERELCEVLEAARALGTEAEAMLEAARASIRQTRAGATKPQDLAAAGEAEQRTRELAVAVAAMQDETLAPAARVADLVKQALPRAVAGALRVLREQHVARATFQLGELRRRAESVRGPAPGESELIALAAEVRATTAQPLAVPSLEWPDDLLTAPQLRDPHESDGGGTTGAPAKASAPARRQGT